MIRFRPKTEAELAEDVASTAAASIIVKPIETSVATTTKSEWTLPFEKRAIDKIRAKPLKG